MRVAVVIALLALAASPSAAGPPAHPQVAIHDVHAEVVVRGPVSGCDADHAHYALEVVGPVPDAEQDIQPDEMRRSAFAFETRPTHVHFAAPAGLVLAAGERFVAEIHPVIDRVTFRGTYDVWDVGVLNVVGCAAAGIDGDVAGLTPVATDDEARALLAHVTTFNGEIASTTPRGRAQTLIETAHRRGWVAQLLRLALLIAP